jgi:hypothetical protein
MEWRRLNKNGTRKRHKNCEKEMQSRLAGLEVQGHASLVKELYSFAFY